MPFVTSWSKPPIGTLSHEYTARYHTATLLDDGTVLAVEAENATDLCLCRLAYTHSVAFYLAKRR